MMKTAVIILFSLCYYHFLSNGGSNRYNGYAFQLPLFQKGIKEISDPSGHIILNRRTLLGIFTLATTTQTSSILQPQKVLAAQTAGEAIRKTAANIPGYGQADVYYPPIFLGKWKATRVIVSSSTSFDDNVLKIPQSMLPLTISYDVRFVTVDGDDGQSNDNVRSSSTNNIGKVIADRQFNEESYYNALREVLVPKHDINSDLPLLLSSSWSPSNPNVLTINYNNGSGKEVKVTKRATDMDEANGIVSSSEYRRITTVASGSLGVPSIEASRIMNKWKINDEGAIEGIEIVYSDGGLAGDPISVNKQQQQQQQQQQQMSSKSRLRLER